MIGIKQIFTWWNKKTLGTFFKTLFLENMWEATHMEINTIKIKVTKDG